MNKIIQSALLVALSTSAVQAQLHSNQTFLRARDSLSNNIGLASHANAFMKHGEKSKFGSIISVAGYYRETHNHEDMAAYFGGGQRVNSDQNGTIVVGSTGPSTASAEARTNTLYNYNVTFDGDNAATISGTTTLKPFRSEYGTHIAWAQDLSYCMKGLSISVDMPVVRVETNLNATSDNTTVASYLAGTYEQTATANALQSKLTHAHMDATKRKKTGLADLGLGINYQMHRANGVRVDGNVNMTIPAGNKTDGVNLFAPQAGNGHHFAIGAGLKSVIALWHTKSGKDGIHLHLDAGARYFFGASQTRTLGLYNHWYDRIATSSQYRLLGKAGATVPVPAANVLTRKVDVKPGLEFDGGVSLRSHWRNFDLVVGYNLHGHDSESVTLHPTVLWHNGEYAMMVNREVADDDTNISSGITVGANAYTIGGAIQAQGDKAAITKDSAGAAVGANNAAQYYVTTAACASPSSITHKVLGSVAYRFNKLKWPLTFSAGGEYEFADKQSNHSVQSWAAWGKASVCF